MALKTTSTASALLLPETVGTLLVQPALDASIAAQVFTLVRTASTTYRFPLVLTDPISRFVNEGEEITPSDAVFAELEVTPAKVAGLQIISVELAEDSNPSAQAAVGDGLSRDLGRRIDECVFSTLAPPAPAGLNSLTTSVVTEAATSFETLDSFAAALSASERVGAQITAFVTSPDEALALAQVKESNVSVRPLLGADPTLPTQRTIYGVPLFVSRYVAPKTVWAIPGARTYLCVRTDARIDVDASVYFTSQRVAVLGSMRVCPAAPHEAAIVKITHA